MSKYYPPDDYVLCDAVDDRRWPSNLTALPLCESFSSLLQRCTWPFLCAHHCLELWTDSCYLSTTSRLTWWRFLPPLFSLSFSWMHLYNASLQVTSFLLSMVPSGRLHRLEAFGSPSLGGRCSGNTTQTSLWILNNMSYQSCFSRVMLVGLTGCQLLTFPHHIAAYTLTKSSDMVDWHSCEVLQIMGGQKCKSGQRYVTLILSQLWSLGSQWTLSRYLFDRM